MFDDRQLNQNYRSSFPCIGQGSNILLPDKGCRIREDEGDLGTDRFLFDIVGFGGANIFSSGQHSSLVGPSNHSIFLPDVIVKANNSARAVSEVVSAEDRFGFFLQLDFRIFSMKRAPFFKYSRNWNPSTIFEHAHCSMQFKAGQLLTRFDFSRSSYDKFKPFDQSLDDLQPIASTAVGLAFQSNVILCGNVTLRGSEGIYIFQRSAHGTLKIIFQLELTTEYCRERTYFIYATSNAVKFKPSSTERIFTFWFKKLSSIDRPASRFTIVDHNQFYSLAERSILLFEALVPYRCALGIMGRVFCLTPTSKSEEALVSRFNFRFMILLIQPSIIAHNKVALKFDSSQHQQVMGNLFQPEYTELHFARFLNLFSTFVRSCDESVTFDLIFPLNLEFSWSKSDRSISMPSALWGNYCNSSCSKFACGASFEEAFVIRSCCVPRPIIIFACLDPSHIDGSLMATFQVGTLNWFTNFALLADHSREVILNFLASSCAFNSTILFSNSTQSNQKVAVVVSSMSYIGHSSNGVILWNSPNSKRAILHAAFRVARAQSNFSCSRIGSLPTSSCPDKDRFLVYFSVRSFKSRSLEHVKAAQHLVAANKAACCQASATIEIFNCWQKRESENGFIYFSAVSAYITSPFDLPVSAIVNFISPIRFLGIYLQMVIFQKREIADVCQSIGAASRAPSEKYCGLEKRFCVDSPSHTKNCSMLHLRDNLHIQCFQAVTTACQTITRKFDYYNESSLSLACSPHLSFGDVWCIYFVYSPCNIFGDVLCIWVRHCYCLSAAFVKRESVQVSSGRLSNSSHDELGELVYCNFYAVSESLLPMVVVSVESLSQSVASLEFAGHFAMASQYFLVVLEIDEMTCFCKLTDFRSSLEHFQFHFYREQCSYNITAALGFHCNKASPCATSWYRQHARSGHVSTFYPIWTVGMSKFVKGGAIRKHSNPSHFNKVDIIIPWNACHLKYFKVDIEGDSRVFQAAAIINFTGTNLKLISRVFFHFEVISRFEATLRAADNSFARELFNHFIISGIEFRGSNYQPIFGVECSSNIYSSSHFFILLHTWQHYCSVVAPISANYFDHQFRSGVWNAMLTMEGVNTMLLPAHFELHIVFSILSSSSVNLQTVSCNAVHFKFQAVSPIVPGQQDSYRLYHPVGRWQTQLGSYFDPTHILYTTTLVHLSVSACKRMLLRCEYNATIRRFSGSSALLLSAIFRKYANEVTQDADLLYFIHLFYPILQVHRLTVWGGGEIDSKKDRSHTSKPQFEESGCSTILNIAADRQPQWERDSHSALSQSVSQYETCNARNGTNNRSRPIILSLFATEVIVSSVQFLGVVRCVGSIIISLKLKSGSKRETATLINGFDNYNKAQRERKRYMAQLSGLVASRERKQVRELEIHFIRIYFDHILEAKIAGKFHAAGESKSSVYYSPLAVISSGLNSVHGNRAVACFTNLQVDRIFFLVKSVSRSGEHCAVPAYVEQIRNPLRIPTKFLLSFGAQHFGTAAIINLSMHFGRWPRGSAITPSSEPFCNRNKSVSFGSTIVEQFQFIHGVFLPNDYRAIETFTPCTYYTW